MTSATKVGRAITKFTNPYLHSPLQLILPQGLLKAKKKAIMSHEGMKKLKKSLRRRLYVEEDPYEKAKVLGKCY